MWIEPKYYVKMFWRIKNTIRVVQNWRAVRKMENRATSKRRETAHLKWMSLRDTVSSSDTLLTATTSKLANVPSHAKRISPGMNALELRFMADADGRSCTAYIYITRIDDDVALLCSVALTAGKQVATDGKYYADTIVVTDLWFTDKDIQKADAAGNDRMARMGFDNLGYDKIFVLFNISSGNWDAEFTGLA